MASLSKDELIALVQRAARANGGRPQGKDHFFSDHGLTKRDLWALGIRSYGDLCELAGYVRNRFAQKPMEADQLFEPLALLTVQIGRFPDTTDREIARRGGAPIPEYRAYRTAQNTNGPLLQQLLEWCRSHPQHSGALQSLEAHVSRVDGAAPPARKRVKVVTGYVYLLRYGGRGRKYKIGRSEAPPRRHSQISGMVPDELAIVHVIASDDPIGIERYWHQRFENKLIPNKKEIFLLDAEDVAAFKRRKYQ